MNKTKRTELIFISQLWDETEILNLTDIHKQKASMNGYFTDFINCG